MLVTKEMIFTTPEEIEQGKLWVKALRSGLYKQGREQLQSSDGFCCLGVACDVLIPRAMQLRDEVNDQSYLAGGFPTAQPHAPGWLRRIRTPNLQYIKRNGKIVEAQLDMFNDQHKLSFRTIANILVNNFPELANKSHRSRKRREKA